MVKIKKLILLFNGSILSANYIKIANNWVNNSYQSNPYFLTPMMILDICTMRFIKQHEDRSGMIIMHHIIHCGVFYINFFKPLPIYCLIIAFIIEEGLKYWILYKSLKMSKKEIMFYIFTVFLISIGLRYLYHFKYLDKHKLGIDLFNCYVVCAKIYNIMYPVNQYEREKKERIAKEREEEQRQIEKKRMKEEDQLEVLNRAIKNIEESWKQYEEREACYTKEHEARVIKNIEESWKPYEERKACYTKEQEAKKAIGAIYSKCEIDTIIKSIKTLEDMVLDAQVIFDAQTEENAKALAEQKIRDLEKLIKLNSSLIGIYKEIEQINKQKHEPDMLLSLLLEKAKANEQIAINTITEINALKLKIEAMATEDTSLEALETDIKILQQIGTIMFKYFDNDPVVYSLLFMLDEAMKKSQPHQHINEIVKKIMQQILCDIRYTFGGNIAIVLGAAHAAYMVAKTEDTKIIAQKELEAAQTINDINIIELYKNAQNIETIAKQEQKIIKDLPQVVKETIDAIEDAENIINKTTNEIIEIVSKIKEKMDKIIYKILQDINIEDGKGKYVVIKINDDGSVSEAKLNTDAITIKEYLQNPIVDQTVLHLARLAQSRAQDPSSTFYKMLKERSYKRQGEKYVDKRIMLNDWIQSEFDLPEEVIKQILVNKGNSPIMFSYNQMKEEYESIIDAVKTQRTPAYSDNAKEYIKKLQNAKDAIIAVMGVDASYYPEIACCVNGYDPITGYTHKSVFVLVDRLYHDESLLKPINYSGTQSALVSTMQHRVSDIQMFTRIFTQENLEKYHLPIASEFYQNRCLIFDKLTDLQRHNLVTLLTTKQRDILMSMPWSPCEELDRINLTPCIILHQKEDDSDSSLEKSINDMFLNKQFEYFAMAACITAYYNDGPVYFHIPDIFMISAIVKQVYKIVQKYNKFIQGANVVIMCFHCDDLCKYTYINRSIKGKVIAFNKDNFNKMPENIPPLKC